MSTSSTKKLKNDDEIEVMNYTIGELIYINERTQQQWTWNGFGDVQSIPYSEIKNIKASYPKFIYEPWFVILNDGVIETLGLTSLYEKIIRPDEINKFYNMPVDKMVEVISQAPENMKLLIAQLTREKIRNREFGDLFKIRLLEDVLKINLLEE